MVARAVGWSLALHALLLGALALAWPRLHAGDDVLLVTNAAWPRLPPAPERTAPPAGAPPQTEPPTLIELRSPADAVVDVAHAGAPSRAPNPDASAGRAAASSGRGAGAPTLLTERADAVTLRAQRYDAASGYALQRIRTGERRASQEAVRATPHPDASAWLSSAASGQGHADRAAHPSGRPRPEPPAPAVDAHGDDRPLPPQERAPAAELRHDERLAAVDARREAGFSRPALASAPAATESEPAADDVADRVDRALVSDEKQPAPLELSRPTSPGTSTSGQGAVAGALGYAPHPSGVAPVPAGAPNLPDARALAAATYQRAYELYLSRVKQKVDPLWEFPRELALRMEQGDVLVGFTIRQDGSLRDLRVLKASGFPSFDKNVLAAVKKAAPFERLPATFGAELRVTAPFEGSNPAIR